jgi:small subunit ribosomal protein S15e
MAEADKKARTFKKYTFRGIELDDLLELSVDKLVPLLNARQRRKFARGIKHAPISFLKKVRASKKKCAYGEKPVPVKTHMRNLTILPEMVGAIVGVYTGKQFVNVEIKPDMIGNYLGEFALTYKPVGHGRAGNARFVP